VLDSAWIEVVALDTREQLAAFAYYEQRLVGVAGRNVGECGVLALAETTPHAVAVVDDRVAANAAKGRNVTIRRTLGLLCEAIRQGLLTVPLVSALADDLIQDSYRLPFGPGGFARWAADQGLPGCQ
jgi:predicted nucleic acid-binding protein